jgi:hypothetical protein
MYGVRAVMLGETSSALNQSSKQTNRSFPRNLFIFYKWMIWLFPSMDAQSRV